MIDGNDFDKIKNVKDKNVNKYQPCQILQLLKCVFPKLPDIHTCETYG